MELSLFLDLITVIAVILGILFGLVQLRHYHLSRRRDAAIFLLNSFQTPEFLQGILIIKQDLPPHLSKEEIEERLGEDVAAIFLVISTWERIGLLLFNREVSLSIVHQAYGREIILSWLKLEQYVTDWREELDSENPFEWYQWLVERLLEYEQANPPVPAYTAYRDWEPGAGSIL